MGIELVLVTESETLSAPQTEIVGNALIAEFANVVLVLPDKTDFLVFEPAAGIAVIQAANLAEGAVQLSITGTEAPPAAEVSAETQTLQLSVTPNTVRLTIFEVPKVSSYALKISQRPSVIPREARNLNLPLKSGMSRFRFGSTRHDILLLLRIDFVINFVYLLIRLRARSLRADYWVYPNGIGKSRRPL